jgi:acrylyl-CoA reductase (NADPH)
LARGCSRFSAPACRRWRRRIARDLDSGMLARMTETISFDRVFEAGKQTLAGQVHGRLVEEI